MRIVSDVLVIGSGIAGLTFALEAARRSRVTVITKRSERDANTAWAQGGIAAVLAPDDSFGEHTADTLMTGGGLSHRRIVELVVEDGPRCIERLVDLGVHFSESPKSEPPGPGVGAQSPPFGPHLPSLDLAREGGHGKRRVVHAGDITGAEIQRALIAALHANPNIQVLEHYMAIDLIDLAKFGGPRRIVGAYALHTESGQVHSLVAHATVLATGGAGKVYLYTTNPDVATGDGVAMAYRAGAAIANMEFFQFHPTCFFHPQAKNFLISEALRGEGGILRLADGTPFMERHHPMKDLAPRDVVARAIDFEMKRTGEDCVWLDMTAHRPDFLRERFPNIHARVLSLGFDLTQQPIPVVPAAHYACGGVAVDQDGRSTLPGLWAVGEVACTGLHGANRLASNSLLEGLVFGYRAAVAMRELNFDESLPSTPDWDPGGATSSQEGVIVTNDWDELRRCMWNYVGIVRSDRRLVRASRRIALLKEEIREYYFQHFVTQDLLELRNIADVAELIITSAAFRKESRGGHYNVDHADTDDAHYRADTVLRWGSLPALRPVI
jgi:L-aspartate oxidase